MNDLVEQQLVKELRDFLQSLNEKYKSFFHVQLLTLCDMKDMRCKECVESETNQQCMRCAVGVTEVD